MLKYLIKKKNHLDIDFKNYRGIISPPFLCFLIKFEIKARKGVLYTHKQNVISICVREEEGMVKIEKYLSPLDALVLQHNKAI